MQNDLETIISSFNDTRKEYLGRIKSLRDAARRNEELARSKHKKARMLQDKMPTYKDFIQKVFTPAAEALGCHLDIAGPFGIFTRYRLVFINNNPDGKDYTVTVQHTNDEEGNWDILYETGETEPRFAPDSIGAWNGGNRKTAPLPDNTEELVELIKRHESQPFR